MVFLRVFTTTAGWNTLAPHPLYRPRHCWWLSLTEIEIWLCENCVLSILITRMSKSLCLSYTTTTANICWWVHIACTISFLIGECRAKWYSHTGRPIGRRHDAPCDGYPYNPPPRQPSLSFFPLVNATEASRLEPQGLGTAFTCRLWDTWTEKSSSCHNSVFCQSRSYVAKPMYVLFYCFLGNVHMVAMVHSWKLLLLYNPPKLVLLYLETGEFLFNLLPVGFVINLYTF